MSNFVLLNNVAHKNLRVVRTLAAQYGDNEMSAVTFPQEFRAVQNEYPIFFQKNPSDGKFLPIALFGLREGENLFLNDTGWDALYVPASVKRRPFLIGIQPPKPGESSENHMVYVDMNSPRLSEIEGEAVFLPHGGYSPYLESVIDTLDYIRYGSELNNRFVDQLLRMELLEVVTVEITLTDGSANNLTGIYTINEEKLQALDAAALAELHSQGFLEFIFMVLASHSNVAKLISRIERKLKS